MDLKKQIINRIAASPSPYLKMKCHSERSEESHFPLLQKEGKVNLVSISAILFLG
jgi:hypothetical protein